MITPERLREVLDYDEVTGCLTWKNRPKLDFISEAVWKTWTTRYAGKKAMNCESSSGYLRGRVLGQYLMAHVVCYAIFFGKFPSGYIDHINGNRKDNRISNLRDVTRSENAKNVKVSTRNTSGVMGVRFVANRWRARIVVSGKEINLGRYVNLEDAISAREHAIKTYGFHENHGRQS